MRFLSQIKQEHIEEFQQIRLASVDVKALADGEKVGNHNHKRLPSPQTVNYEVSVLRSAFLWAIDHSWISVEPTRKVKPLRPGLRQQVRILDEEECRRLLETCRRMGEKDEEFLDYASAFQFILNTGLRSGELCSLTWGGSRWV